MKGLENRIKELEKRGKQPIKEFVVWYANPLQGDPEPRPEVGPDDLFFEVHYVDPPVYPDAAA